VTVGDDVAALAVAGAVGLLLGVERERRKGDGPRREAAGLRTFALAGLLGAILRIGSGPGGAIVGVAFVGALAVVARLRARHDDPGITTEIALVVTFALGVLAVRHPELAAATGVAVACVLALRGWLHHIVRDLLSEDELHDLLLFLASAVIALPLMPDRAMGPFGVINPFAIWRLVVIIMAVSGAGYLAVRIAGPRLGLAVSGFVSGFVSAAATVAAMGTRAREHPELTRAATAGAALASVPTVLLAAALVGTADRDTLVLLAPSLSAAGVATIAWAGALALRAGGDAPELDPEGRAFDLRSALGLAALITGMLALSTLANKLIPHGGVIAAGSIGGFADAHSAALAAAVMAEEGKVSAHDAALAVLAALTTNSLTKAVLALGARERRFATGVSTGLFLMTGSAWVAWVLVHGST
jgi:uncharacterized membrane protein (DUF4010 family)